MSDMKCPFCNKELEPIIGACEDTEYYCQNCDYMTGDENLWNKLTKYKQALDIAVGALNAVTATPLNSRVIHDVANKALEQITALEQKDK